MTTAATATATATTAATQRVNDKSTEQKKKGEKAKNSAIDRRDKGTGRGYGTEGDRERGRVGEKERAKRISPSIQMTRQINRSK